MSWEFLSHFDFLACLVERAQVNESEILSSLSDDCLHVSFHRLISHAITADAADDCDYAKFVSNSESAEMMVVTMI